MTRPASGFSLIFIEISAIDAEVGTARACRRAVRPSANPNAMPLPPPSPPLRPVFLDGVDVTRKYVRITAERGAFVEFDFAIGWPELSVELVLPRAAFEEFCARNAVTFLDPEPDESTPRDDEET